MKKLISVIMAAVFLCGSSPLSTMALKKEDPVNYPVVIVPGYSSSPMYYTKEDGSREQVWGISTDAILSEVLKNIAEVGLGAGMLTFGKTEYIAKTAGQGFAKLLGRLACNDDGSSKYPLSLYRTSAEDTCSETLLERYPNNTLCFEPEIMAEVAKYTGNENIFNFNCDFRMSITDCAGHLDAYIQDVLQYTHSDKVNIIAVSHGGQVTAAYLTLYGFKQQVNNAVLNVPAIGGAGLAYDALEGKFDFNEAELAYYFEYGMIEETDYHWLVKAQQLGFLDDILDTAQPYILEVLGHWKSIWDFVPAAYYDGLKKKRLDKDRNAAIIASSDYVHYTLMPEFYSSLQRCNDEYGMHVSIIAGTDNAVVTGLKANSDGIITTAASTGAVTAPFGMRFADGYTAANGDNRFVSPSMTVDASTAYLPNNTWFVEGLFHGMEYKDPYSARLLIKLLLTQDIAGVYSDPEYPRFHATTNATAGVFAAFNKSAEGLVCSEDTSLKVTNLSKKYRMKILAVNSDSMKIRIHIEGAGWLKPGESVTLPFSGEIPAVSKTGRGITVTYLLGSPTPVSDRTLHFTVMNGPAPAYNTASPYTQACTYDAGAGGTLLTQWNGMITRVLSYWLSYFRILAR